MRRFLLVLLALVLLAGAWNLNIAVCEDTLSYGERNNDVLQMQKRLQELGFFTEKCTGYFGDVTQTAVTNFQRANGLTATGIVDDETLAKMKAQDAVTKQQYIEYSKQGEMINMTLKPGENGKWVKKLQTYLKELGYFNTDVTGYYGEVTQYSVKFFQLVNSLPVTGVADSATLTKLSSPSAIPAGNHEKGLLLKYGSSGRDVRTLQNYLKDLGYFSGECSAKFGKITQDAVTELQRCNGLEETGECDVKLRIMLLCGEVISKKEAEKRASQIVLKPGDVNEGVRIVKQQLFELGYYSGSIDNVFNDALGVSIHLYQAANGLKTTKYADKETRAYLNGGKGITYSEYIRKMSYAEVRYGSKGISVELLQMRLKELNFYEGEINGSFDKATEQAVKMFQRGHLMKETGKADHATREVMNSEDALDFEAAEKNYFEYIRTEQREKALKSLLEMAKDCVSLEYEAGKIGEKTYGNAGLTYSLYKKVGIELSPTVGMQLENAMQMEGWSEDIEDVDVGSHVFLQHADGTLTGIYIGEAMFVYASPIQGKVVSVKNIMETGDYEFIGSILYF